MKRELLDLLSCPYCGEALKAVAFEEDGGEAKDGLLYCVCKRGYPIVDFIPRMLSGAFSLYPDFMEKYKGRIVKYLPQGVTAEITDLKGVKKKTQLSFGYQWTYFYQMSCDFRENFLNYIYPVRPEFFAGKLGLDTGCGFGRHILHAAGFGAKMVGIDFSRAIESSRRNTMGIENIYLAQADIYKLPFADNTFDFIYSIGVLHHLPDPEAGFRSLVKLLKPRGAVFIWMYSNKRKWAVRLIELARKFTTHMPFRLLKATCFIIALIDYCFFIVPFKLVKENSRIRGWLKRLFPRSFLYVRYPFQVNFADWFDRLAAPVRFYYDGKDLEQWFERAGLVNVRVSPTGLYGWRGYGEKQG